MKVCGLQTKAVYTDSFQDNYEVWIATAIDIFIIIIKLVEKNRGKIIHGVQNAFQIKVGLCVDLSAICVISLPYYDAPN